MSKIYLAEKTQLDSAATPFATCSTAAATAAKTVTVSGFTLKTGAMISIKFTYANTAANPTLNVNGTGAISIYYHDLAVPTGMFTAGGVYLLAYNGARWEVMGNHFANSNTGIKSLLFSSGSRTSVTDKGETITVFSRNMDYGSLYAQGYRAILISYVTVNSDGSCKLTCEGYASAFGVSDQAPRSLSINIPSSGTSACKFELFVADTYAPCASFYWGNAYLLT